MAVKHYAVSWTSGIRTASAKNCRSVPSPPRIPAADAPAGLVMAATHSTQAPRVQRSLARLEEALKANPPGHHASPAYHESVETALGELMQDLHQLPTESLQQKAADITGQHLPN